MPTYEYECSACGEQVEYSQSIADPPKEKCESCGGKLTKLLSAGTGLIFKGSGFYITDYKTKSGDSEKSESKPSGAESAKSPEPATAPTDGGSAKKDSKSSAPPAAPAPAASKSEKG